MKPQRLIPLALALTALALKHEFETRAECGFIGTGYHFDVRRRTLVHPRIDAPRGICRRS